MPHEQKIYRPELPEILNPTEQLAAQALAAFLRVGIQPPKGTLKVAANNNHVIGEALLAEGVQIGTPEVDDRWLRLMSGLAKFTTSQPSNK